MNRIYQVLRKRASFCACWIPSSTHLQSPMPTPTLSSRFVLPRGTSWRHERESLCTRQIPSDPPPVPNPTFAVLAGYFRGVPSGGTSQQRILVCALDTFPPTPHSPTLSAPVACTGTFARYRYLPVRASGCVGCCLGGVLELGI